MRIGELVDAIENEGKKRSKEKRREKKRREEKERMSEWTERWIDNENARLFDFNSVTE